MDNPEPRRVVQSAEIDVRAGLSGPKDYISDPAVRRSHDDVGKSIGVYVARLADRGAELIIAALGAQTIAVGSCEIGQVDRGKTRGFAIEQIGRALRAARAFALRTDQEVTEAIIVDIAGTADAEPRKAVRAFAFDLHQRGIGRVRQIQIAGVASPA